MPIHRFPLPWLIAGGHQPICHLFPIKKMSLYPIHVPLTFKSYPHQTTILVAQIRMLVGEILVPVRGLLGWNATDHRREEMGFSAADACRRPRKWKTKLILLQERRIFIHHHHHPNIGPLALTHTHTHWENISAYISIYIYMDMCVWVCVVHMSDECHCVYGMQLRDITGPYASTEVKPPPEVEGMDRSEIEESGLTALGLSYNVGTPKPWVSIPK